MLRHISLLAPLALVAGPALAQTVHVRADLTTGANNGSTWADAFQGEDGLRAALAVATPGTEIWVAGGTYRAEPAAGPGLGFTVTTQSLTLRGGFVGTETSIFERTDPERRPVVLSGDAFGNDDGTAATLGDNALAVLRVLNAGRFTMEYVQVTDSANVGFLAEDSNARVSNCAFAGCLGSGGTVLGVGAFSTSGPGGRFDDCRFEDNGVDGLFFRGSPGTGEQVAIQRCVFRDNGRHGLSIGGDPSSVFQVQNSVFHRNGGSGVVLPLYIEGGTDVDLFQCTIAENDGVGILSTGSCGFCIFIPRCVGCLEWDNGTATSAIKYVGGLVEGSAAAAGFTAADVFEDLASGDLRPAVGSPAIDTDMIVPSAEPLLDVTRGRRTYDDPAVSGFDTDAGAYERTPFIGAYGGCTTTANSTGVPGRIDATGSLAAADNDLALTASDLPPQQFGIFVAGRRLDSAPLAGGSGTLCLGGGIGRFNAPGQILSSGPGGTFSLDVDLTQLPQPSAFVAAQPGETWLFQAWHRDFVPGVGSTNNLTDVVTLRIR